MHLYLAHTAAYKFESVFVDGLFDSRYSKLINLVVDLPSNLKILVIENKVGLVTFQKEAAECLGTTPITFFVHVVVIELFLQFNEFS